MKMRGLNLKKQEKQKSGCNGLKNLDIILTHSFTQTQLYYARVYSRFSLHWRGRKNAFFLLSFKCIFSTGRSVNDEDVG